jgi:hypothetical protein
MTAFDELSTLERFILRHDMPDLEASDMRDAARLKAELERRTLSIMQRTRIQQQVSRLLAARHAAGDVIRQMGV